MTRLMALGVLILVGGLSLALQAGQAPQDARGRGQQARVIEVEKLKDNLFVLKAPAGGGNTAVFITANGVVVVDTKNPGWGQPILTKIKELTDKPVTTIINTHTHADHVSGNVEFPATVEVIVQDNTAANMKKMLPVTGVAPPGSAPGPNIFDQNNGRGLPKRTFKDTLTIGTGADRIELHYYGRGHTNGDAWVLFPALRVVHAGDIFAWPDQIPILDENNGGTGVGIADTQMRAHAALNTRADGIITGHSAVMTFDDLRKIADFNRGFLAAITQAKRAGKTVEETVKAWTPPPGFAAPPAVRLQGNVQTIYNELK